MKHKDKIKRQHRTTNWVESRTPIEQQLDMAEDGSLRGEEIQYSHGITRSARRQPSFRFDMAEENREGSEMTGDEHSLGLQGGGTEDTRDQNVNSLMPGADADRETSPDSIDPDELDRTG